MKTAETTTAVAAGEKAKGFPGLCCLKCGDENTVVLDLQDGQFHCGNCDADYDCDEVRGHINLWLRVVAWVETIPDAE